MHRVAVLAQEGVVALELATAVQVFEAANVRLGADAYEVGVAGDGDWVASASLSGPSSFAVRPEYDWRWAARADTVVVPAHTSFLDPPPEHVLELLLAAHERGARIASLCAGAFTVAATGLLDGRPATTHWYWCAEFARRHPAVLLSPKSLFVGQDGVYSAAGVTAALDLCLHLVELDRGAAVAAGVARMLVAPVRRDGGQSQYIAYDTPARPDELAATLHWAEEHLAEDLSLADLARQAAMSQRTFSRRFAAGVGTTPMHWLLRTRIRRAQELLESTDLSVDRIAHDVGFRSTSTFRHHFGRLTETTPQRYRRAFSTGR
ncbi:GlxA family transcriptional regulator [Actinokineospora pegani]|uniref:GlxA family transcriptional regulator n=1 Tax=Actinokineospora pegani TaxID=2654637 RepID=UPI0012EA053A|nr:helix-turn-helix domain-containing protein [Actinokineospora pegani]